MEEFLTWWTREVGAGGLKNWTFSWTSYVYRPKEELSLSSKSADFLIRFFRLLYTCLAVLFHVHVTSFYIKISYNNEATVSYLEEQYQGTYLCDLNDFQ